MRVAIGSDIKNSFTEFVARRVGEMGHATECFGALAGHELTWADVAIVVAEQVRDQRCQEGIVMCWTGTGVTLAANKVKSVRAALCKDAETARRARQWNFANLLAMAVGSTDREMARDILEAWFGTPYGAGDLGFAIARIHAYDTSRG